MQILARIFTEWCGVVRWARREASIIIARRDVMSLTEQQNEMG
jgi:hypothetical protein